MKKRDVKEQITNWNLKKKISFFISLLIMGTSLIILTASTFSAFYYMTNQTREMATSQLETLASNYDDTLEQYQNLAVALVINDSVQKYCASDVKRGLQYEQQASNVYNILLNMLNVQNNMNFAVVSRDDTEDYVYKGNSSVVDARFEVVYEQDYEESISAKEGSTVRMSFANHYFRNEGYTLTLYHPIYATTRMVHKNGMLVMNLSDNLVEQLREDTTQSLDSELFLMDINGKRVSIADKKKIGKQVDYLKRIKGSRGSFQADGALIIYQRIGKWNYYLVNEIPMFELYKGSFGNITILLGVIVLMSVLSIALLRRMIQTFYRPIDRVVSVMDQVAEGTLEVRIDTESMDADSRKLAVGFNSMMDEIAVLMEQVKMEQHQLEQIRFNALQSQKIFR